MNLKDLEEIANALPNVQIVISITPADIEEILTELRNQRKRDEILKTTLVEAGFPCRITNAMNLIDVRTFEDLLGWKKKDIRKCRGVGNKAVKEIDKYLSYYGIKWQ